MPRLLPGKDAGTHWLLERALRAIDAGHDPRVVLRDPGLPYGETHCRWQINQWAFDGTLTTHRPDLALVTDYDVAQRATIERLVACTDGRRRNGGFNG